MPETKRGRAERIFRFLLKLFPFDFRHDYGRDMEQVFREQRRDAAQESGLAPIRLWSKTIRGVFSTALSEHVFIFGRDARYALRTLWQAKVFTIVVILTLAVGIGANTAIFSVVNGVLLRPLPYDGPEQLFRLYGTMNGTIDGGGNLTAPDFIDVRDSGIFEGLASLYDYQPTGFDLSGDGVPQRVRSLQISSNFFEVLGLQPLLGRTFELNEETGAPLTILGYGLWSQRFGGDPGILGSQLVLDGNPFTVVGVMPRGVRGPTGLHPDLWIPLDLTPGGRNHRDNHYLSVVGRLRQGTGLIGGQRELDGLMGRLAETYEINQGRAGMLVALHDDLVGNIRPMLYILLGAVGLVLLIGCANVANMFLARGTNRERELAIRTALGSGRGRLVRQLLTENLLLAAASGIGGVAIALVGIRVLLNLGPGFLPLSDGIVFDGNILAFACGLSFVTALVFGLIPAINVSRPNLSGFLADGNPRSAGGVRQHRFRSLFVLSQVSMAMILLVGAGLLIRSFSQLANVPLGFRTEEVLTYVVNLPDGRYGEPDQRAALYNELYERVESLPGVEAAGGISVLPATGEAYIWGVRLLGLEVTEDEDGWGNANIRCVDGNYFKALDVALLEGRLLDGRDREGSAPVVVVSREFSETYFPAGDALGQPVMLGGMQPPRTIVGIVGDTRQNYMEPAARTLYVSHNQFADNRNWTMNQVVRSELPAGVVLSGLRREVAAIDPNLVVHSVRTMNDVAALGIASRRFAMVLMGTFSAIALLLAATGIYGVLAYTVSQRLHEIGIRKALGAQEASVWRLVMTQGLAPVLGGVAIGLVGAFWLGGYLSSLVYEVSATDPTTLVGGALGLVLVAFLAAAYPARRASRIDPVRVLRGD